jgi:hypothetical protein
MYSTTLEYSFPREVLQQYIRALADSFGPIGIARHLNAHANKESLVVALRNVNTTNRPHVAPRPSERDRLPPFAIRA